jgi:exodeoxyribonuclease VIII
MRDAIRANAAARELLECPGKGEMSFFWRDAETGIWCKGRVDRFCEWMGFSVILDLKTTTDASPGDFKWQVARQHYHVKAAWYLDGLNAVQKAQRRFIWLAVEKDPPYLCALYEPPDEPGAFSRPDISLQRGRSLYRSLLERYASCEKSGVWPGYSEGVEPLGAEGGE